MTATTAADTPAPKKKHGLRETIAALGNPRIASMAALGFASGLPFLLTGATFGYWLRDEGTTLTAIGFLSWVGLAYTFKVFWAPMVDRAKLPMLSKLGQRRSWAIFAQLLVAAGLILMSIFGPHGAGGLATIGAFALLVAFASATQDIAVDAWRIESAGDADELGLFTSAFQLGYRVALLFSDALILIFAQHLGWQPSYVLMALLMGVGLAAAWFTPEPTRTEAIKRLGLAVKGATPQWRVMTAAGVFALAALISWWFSNQAGSLDPGGDLASASQFGNAFAVVFLLCAVGVMARLPHVWMAGAAAIAAIVLVAFYGAVSSNNIIGGAPMFWPVMFCIVASALAAPAGIFDAFLGPLIQFFRAHGAIALVMLLMISVYRLPEFVIGPVAGPFYSDLGFGKDVVGGVRATVGLIASTAGIVAGGLSIAALGFSRTLIIGAVLQGLGVASFALLAFNGPDIGLFSFAMASDNFCYAFAGVALVTYMSSLTSLGYTATQYALMSSIYTIFGKFLKGFSGAVVDGFQASGRTLMESYGLFYIGAGLIAAPALILCIVLMARQPRRIPDPAPS